MQRSFLYSRWDGSQAEFSLDPARALDALSDLLMEGLDVHDALEWMRRHGFELAGLQMRVMGLEELVEELRAELNSLYERYSMQRATRDLRRRLDEILDAEQRALRGAHGYESTRMNDFLQRRHAEDAELSRAIERYRDWRFEDTEAGEAYRELREELERLRRLERFLREKGGRFQGQEPADYETAQAVRERIEQLEELARRLAEGDFGEVSPESLRELLGDAAARSFILLRDLESGLRRAGYLRGAEPELTPRAIRRIGAQALAEVYGALRKDRPGGHELDARGAALPRPDESRPYAFGDRLDLDIPRTLLNAVRRRAQRGSGRGIEQATRPRRAQPRPAAGGPCGQAGSARRSPARWAGERSSIELAVDDFEVREHDTTTQTTTVLLLDMSWSMSWAGRFGAAKRVALALDHLIRTRYPRDHFAIVGFSTRARELSVHELPEVSWDLGDPFTNLQEGLMLAERIIRKHPSASPQVLVVSDGQPTAYFQGKELRVEWPMGFGGVSPHAVAETMKQVRRVTRRGITINTFMLDDSPELVGFVERMTQLNRGRAFFTSPAQLGSFLMVDYLSQRRRRGG